MDTRPISDFFDRETCCKPKKAEKKLRSGPAGVSKTFLTLLQEAGVGGRAVLEIGCGTGALSVELLKLGAERVTGLDLSPGSIQLARRRAARAGADGRAAFDVGDGATANLAPHDVVISDKVICCYPDPSGLLSNSLPVATAVYGFVAPASRGARGFLARGIVGLTSVYFRLTRTPFRPYVHNLRAIDARVRSAGFRPPATARHGWWHVAVYSKNGSSNSSPA